MYTKTISMEIIISRVFLYCSNNLGSVITEYASKGCLYDHLVNNRLDFHQILRWSTEIALGKSDIM